MASDRSAAMTTQSTSGTLQLRVQQAQLDYLGAFGRPALGLWGNTPRLLPTLYEKLADRAPNLSDYRIEGDATAPATQGILVQFGSRGNLRFTFERIEARAFDLTPDGLKFFEGVIRDIQTWLRESVPQSGFRSHLLSYSSHSLLPEGTSSSDYLRRLSTIALRDLGANRGSGIVYHADLPDKHWRLQYTVDHSLAIEHGLYLQFALLAFAGDAEIGELRIGAETLFDTALRQTGLSIEGRQ
ncbi:MAG TPA: hypothetical protein VFA43_23400 [Gemmatimonadaceae bacterium]|nr:hypothetical protein [Gemmatimonadaceae bacterium]